MTELLSTEQMQARARMRRSQLGDGSGYQWPIIVEGWRGGRQVCGLAVPTSSRIEAAATIARTVFDLDTLVVFSDSRMLHAQTDSAADQELIERYKRGEVTLLELAMAGDPRVVDQMAVISYSADRGLGELQMLPYLIRYDEVGNEVDIVWDLEDPWVAVTSDGKPTGRIPSALEHAMDARGDDPDVWGNFDERLLALVVDAFERVCDGRFVILAAEPRITAAAGASVNTGPGSVAAAGTAQSSEMNVQLVAREVKP